MRPITISTFLSKVEDWLQWRVDFMPNNALPFQAQGGWEGWAQVELGMYFANSSYDVIREQAIYSSMDRADFVVNNHSHSDLYPKIAVEMKCQSVYVTSASFQRSVKADITKLGGVDSGYRKLIIAFIIDPTTLGSFTANGYVIRGFGQFAFASKVVT